MIAPTLPTLSDLQPQLDKLETLPGSVLLIAIEAPSNQNFHRVTTGCLNADERKALRRALSNAMRKREGQSIQ